MNFHLSEDQIALKTALHRYVADQCDGGARRGAFESETGHDPAFWNGLVDLGAGGIAVSGDHGGLGLDLIDLALVAEVLGYEAAPGPFIGHALAAFAVDRGGSPEQQSAWLGKMAAGPNIATLAIGEASDSWLPEAWKAEFSAGRISGTKTNVLGGGEAEVAVVGVAGGRLALVDVSDRAHVEVRPQDGIDRTRRISELHFDGAAAELLPHADADRLFDAMLTLVAADAYGAARRMLDLTADYTKTREQFGQPVGQFQAVKHQLANLAAHITPCESLYWYAAIAGEPGTGDGAPDARRIAASLAKSHIAERAMEAGRIAVELHGGIGFTWDYDLQIWVKRTIFDFAYGGTPSVHRAIAMELKEASAGSEAGLAQFL